MPRLVHLTTVPETLGFFRGHVAFLKSRGYEVVALSSPGPQLEGFGASENIDVCAVPMQRRIAPWSDLGSLVRLFFALSRLRPDIVHSTTPKAGLLGTIAARAVGAKAVLSVFGLAQMTRSGAVRRLLNVTTWVACRLADRVWCDSFSLRDYLVKQRLCAAGKIFVAAHGSVNGVDAVGRFDPALFGSASRRETRQAWSIPEHAFVIGFVGRIVRDKGIHELRVAWQALRAVHGDIHLLLVGRQEETDPISPEDERVLRNDPRVHFTGPQGDVRPLFGSMDLFVMPSYREGFGVTNIEAAAFALPVVSTDIPGCVDSVVDDHTGTLVPVRDAGALLGAVEAYYADAALRRRHGEAGRARVMECFRPQAIWSAVEAEYSALVRQES